jgi:long-chain acyl-CoA synthetase
MKASTLAELLQQRARSTPSAEAYRQFEARTGTWMSLTWSAFAQRVRSWRSALRAEGLQPGDRVALLVPNGIDHVCMDQAAQSLGLVTVPMHMIDQPESLSYVLADSGAALLLVDSASHWSSLQPLESQFPGLRRVVCLAGQDLPPGGKARSIGSWLETTVQPAGEDEAVRPDGQALASIVYTSGTTGRPKGVMLSHGNVLSNVYAVMDAIPVHPSDVFLSFLPLSHTLERTAGYYLPMAAGATVVFARSVQALMEDLRSARPTVLISVPRIYERAAVAIQESLRRKPLDRALFDATVRVGWRRFERARAARPASPVDELLWGLLDRAVARRVRARFGGRLRAAVTGGAPMPESVARTFLALGVPVLQGYGLTESAPVIAVNRLDDNDPQSVGPPLPGMEVRIGENDELLVRGPNVMRGYWQRPEDTAKVLGSDGWLHTGDQAQLENGRLFIRGRIKDIIVTSTGEKIAPADVESAILADPVFEQAMVLGESRPYVAALVVLNRSRWEEEARGLGLPAAEPASLASPAARAWALARIAKLVRAIPAYARPRAVYLSLSPWTIDAGLITPTLKPKRLAIERRFAGEVASLYEGHI